MRLSIFWRVILVQSALVALILGLSLYALTELKHLAQLSSAILNVDSPCIEQEKRLLKIFLAQMRDAKKFLLLQDRIFYASFQQGTHDFRGALEGVERLVDSPTEKELLQRIRTSHQQFVKEFDLATSEEESWQQKSAELGESILGATEQLIRLRENLTAEKTEAARDRAASAATLMAWLTIGGVSAAVLLAYLHARGVNRPLKKLAKEMHQVGEGEFSRCIDIRAPQEIEQLAEDFNGMVAKLAELDQMKADFISHVSHELRTPLTAMREGTAILLEEISGPLTASQRKVLEVLSSNSDRLYRSICSILDLSKMEAGMMEYQLVPCDPAALIHRSVTSVELIARTKGIHLESNLAEDLPVIFADEERIQQVLDNLLGNALKFTPAGGKIIIGAKTRRENESARLLEVSVSDSGEGIPAEDLQRVFERFYQSPPRIGRTRPGTGLGLPIARHIVEHHQGKIRVESEPGTGSVFSFTLPIWADNSPWAAERQT